MIQLTHQELYGINPLEPRKILLSTFEQTGGNFLRTAKELSCSRNTVKKFVRRQKTGLPLEDFPRRPKRSLCQTAKEIKGLVVKERKLTKSKKRRGKFRSISYYDWEKIYPFLELKMSPLSGSTPTRDLLFSTLWARYFHLSQRHLLFWKGSTLLMEGRESLHGLQRIYSHEDLVVSRGHIWGEG